MYLLLCVEPLPHGFHYHCSDLESEEPSAEEFWEIILLNSIIPEIFGERDFPNDHSLSLSLAEHIRCHFFYSQCLVGTGLVRLALMSLEQFFLCEANFRS